MSQLVYFIHIANSNLYPNKSIIYMYIIYLFIYPTVVYLQ